MCLKTYVHALFLVYVLLFLSPLCPAHVRPAAAPAGSYDLPGPRIALTFDDGPDKKNTPVLLDGLKKRGVKVSFFLIGENVDAGNNREIVRRMYEEGHLIGNHTYHHVKISKLKTEEICREIDRTNAILKEITKEAPQFIRPPFGQWKKGLENGISMIPVLWSVDPMDWYHRNTDEIVQKVVTNVKENDIILLHDCYESSVQAAFRIIDILKGRGFEFVTVDKLLLPG